MNNQLNEIKKELEALLKTEQEDSGFGSNLAEHNYEQGMKDAIGIVESYMEDQSRDDIRQGRERAGFNQ